MPNILPVSDLRNYNEVLIKCSIGEPVFLTKNGRVCGDLPGGESVSGYYADILDYGWALGI